MTMKQACWLLNTSKEV